MSKDNWLHEQLTRIENKVDRVEETMAQAVTDIAINKQCYHSLYDTLENHKLYPCPQVTDGIDKHNTEEHKGLAGKILLYVSVILGSLATIIGATWYLATHIKL